MGCQRQRPSIVYDPIGLVGVPMPLAPMAAGLKDSVRDDPKLTTGGTESTGVHTAATTIGGLLITVLIVVGLVALPGAEMDRSTPSRGDAKMAYAAWCPRSNALLPSPLVRHISSFSTIDDPAIKRELFIVALQTSAQPRSGPGQFFASSPRTERVRRASGS